MDVRVRGALIAAALTFPLAASAQPKDNAKDKEPADDSGESTGASAEPPPAAAPDPKSSEPAAEPAAQDKGFTWAPFGYLRLMYLASQNDPNVQFVGRDDGFQLQNARVGVHGALGTRAWFVVSIDGAVDERTQINTPEGKLRVGLRDAYADVGITRVAANPLVVRAGFFQSLVDPESLIPDTARAFVDKPLESRGIRATEGYQTQGLTPGRSIGAALRLDPKLPVTAPAIGFELAVQNGADEYSSNNDNDKPAASGALLVRLPHDTHLVGAVRYNPRTVGDLPFRQDENDLQASGGLMVTAGPVMAGGGIVFVQTSFPTTGGPDRKAFGGHGQVMVRLGDDAMPIAIGYRFCIFDPSSLILTDRVMEHTAGAVFGVPTYRMRVQLQATHVIEQAGRELSNSRIQLAAEVAL